MALPATDNFNRAGPGLGTNWTSPTLYGIPAINASINVRTEAVGSDSGARWNADTFAADQYAQITVTACATANTRAVFGCVRMDTGGAKTFYGGGVRGPLGASATANIRKNITGTVTNITSTTKTINTTDILRTEVIGTTGTNLTLYVNGVASITASDGAIASGSGGIAAFVDAGLSTDALLDNWEGGNVTAAATNAARLRVNLQAVKRAGYF